MRRQPSIDHMRKRYRFQVLNPGHFHAALLFKEAEYRLLEEIDLIVPKSEQALPFIDLIERFNERETQPTNWKVTVHEREDLSFDPGVDKSCCVAVIAGQNHKKLETVAQLVEQGRNVLVDKPMLTDADQLPLIDRVFAGPGQVMELMTARHQILSRLCQAIAERESLFGGFVDDDEPALTLSSTHHLCKQVNDEPLIRPPWYYDVAVQGNGVVDIQNHMIDQAMWFVLGDAGPDEGTTLQLDAVRQWSTPVSLELFKNSTGLSEFPSSLSQYIDDEGLLQLQCNSEIDWRINGVRIRTRAQWDDHEPEDGGDVHKVNMRGSRCRVEAVQSAESDFFPWIDFYADDDDSRSSLSEALQQCCDEWTEDRFPRIGFSELRAGFHMLIPRALDRGHESHFALVREQFLNYLEDDGVTEAVRSRTKMRYRLLGEAHTMAAKTAQLDQGG